jgi:hypothetical protein
MTEPTKGPYQIGTLPATKIQYPFGPDLWQVDVRDDSANLVGRGYGATLDQALANAQMFAVAWESLEQLRDALAPLLEPCEDHPTQSPEQLLGVGPGWGCLKCAAWNLGTRDQCRFCNSMRAEAEAK